MRRQTGYTSLHSSRTKRQLLMSGHVLPLSVIQVIFYLCSVQTPGERLSLCFYSNAEKSACVCENSPLLFKSLPPLIHFIFPFVPISLSACSLLCFHSFSFHDPFKFFFPFNSCGLHVLFLAPCTSDSPRPLCVSVFLICSLKVQKCVREEYKACVRAESTSSSGGKKEEKEGKKEQKLEQKGRDRQGEGGWGSGNRRHPEQAESCEGALQRVRWCERGLSMGVTRGQQYHRIRQESVQE